MRLMWPRKRKEKRMRPSPSCGGLGIVLGYWSLAFGLYQGLLVLIVPGFESKRQIHTEAVDG